MEEKVVDSKQDPIALDKVMTMSLAPHIKSNESTRSIMLDVIIAMTPAMIGSVYFFGMKALMLILVSVVSAVVFEAGIQKFFKKDILIGD